MDNLLKFVLKGVRFPLGGLKVVKVDHMEIEVHCKMDEKSYTEMLFTINNSVKLVVEQLAKTGFQI